MEYRNIILKIRRHHQKLKTISEHVVNHKAIYKYNAQRSVHKYIINIFSVTNTTDHHVPFLSFLIDSEGRLACSRLLWTEWRQSRIRYILLHVYIFMMLSCIYLGHSGNTVLISNLQFKTKSGKKQRENIYRGNLILDSLKGISHWEY